MIKLKAHDSQFIPAPLNGLVSVDWRYVPASTLGGTTDRPSHESIVIVKYIDRASAKLML